MAGWIIRWKRLLWLALSWVICLAVCAWIYFYFSIGNTPAGGATLFAGGLATAGWLFTNFRTRENQIEKNTYDLILTYQKDAYYVAHRKTVLQRFAPYASIDSAQASALVDKYYDQAAYGGETSEAYSLVQIINFYEYLAIGIRRGMLSNSLCSAYFRTTLSSFHSKKATAFVSEVIKRDNDSRKDASKSAMFSNYLWLIKHWEC